MTREKSIAELRAGKRFDFLIIGGGATGLGAAMDAAARGYRVALVEQHDFAKGTSSRSTKLIHGGVRYLQMGQIDLVRHALEERALLLRNAPEIVSRLEFVIPAYRVWERPFYWTGLKMYDALAGGRGVGRSRWLSREETVARLAVGGDLRGGVSYFDAQFDDAALALAVMRAATERGAAVANYVRVEKLVVEAGRVCGAELRDIEGGGEFAVRARVVVNATGVFCDAIRRMEDAGAGAIVRPSRGAHVVLPREFLPGDAALLIPRTPDGRVVFAIPWLGRVLVGTTDVPVGDVPLEPVPSLEEIEFLLETAGRYLARKPSIRDVTSVFAGLRPLVLKPGAKSTAALSRDHEIVVSEGGLVTIAGGKWTTFRRMAEQVIDRAEQVAARTHRECGTRSIALTKAPFASGERLHPQFPWTDGDVRAAVRDEMARTPEDVLARRTRLLFLDAAAAMQAAFEVTAIIAEELRRDDAWREREVASFVAMATNFLPPQ